jgi:hypothetical protein
MTTIGKPKIDHRQELTYMGIRAIAPFKGMAEVIDKISKDLTIWASDNSIKTAGPPFYVSM